MSQSSFNIANVTRTLFRAAVNAALQALASLNSESTEPATMYPYMLWADTGSGKLKQRNAANDAWIEKGNLADVDWGFLNKAGGSMVGLFNQAAGADIASAATVDLTAATGNCPKVTGTTAVSAWTMNTGQQMKVIAAGALPLTYHATTNNIEGGQSYTCEANDIINLVKGLDGVIRVRIDKQNGTSVISNSSQHGQCRLDYDGSANLVLTPVNGNKLIINGQVQTIPSAGVSLAPSGTASATLYYIYAYMNSGTMTLEYSATGHSTDATTGVEIKTGDATRTLVGMARTADSSSSWADLPTRRYVLSYFNRREILGEFNAVAGRTTTSGSLAEVNTADRLGFLKWADEDVLATGRTTMTNNTAGNINMFFAITFSGTTDAGVSRAAATSFAATVFCSMSVSSSSASNAAIAGLEGYFYVGINASTAAGTATLQQAYTGTTVITRG